VSLVSLQHFNVPLPGEDPPNTSFSNDLTAHPQPVVMRFSFATVALVFAAAFTSAAVVPRAYQELPSTIEARSYQPEEVVQKFRRGPFSDPELELQTRRLHARDIRASDRVVVVAREVEDLPTQIVTRRLHPRDFPRRPVVVVAREIVEPAPTRFARDDVSGREAVVVIARSDDGPQLYRRHPRDFRMVRSA